MAVQLHSLSTASLNGKIGRCERLHKGRYGVLLDADQRKIAVRPENLRVAPATTASAPPSKSVFADLDLRSFAVGNASYQNSDLCTYSLYSKISSETRKFLFDELLSSRYRYLSISSTEMIYFISLGQLLTFMHIHAAHC